jgi:hypothetical protein
MPITCSSKDGRPFYSAPGKQKLAENSFNWMDSLLENLKTILLLATQNTSLKQLTLKKKSWIETYDTTACLEECLI